MLVKKNKVKNFIITIMFLSMFMISCTKTTTSVSDFVKLLKDEVGYNVEYIEDRKVIRVTEYLSKDTIIGAISDDNVYEKWVELRSNTIKLYDESLGLAKSKNINDVEFEMVIIDKDSAKTDQEIPLLIVNKDGVLLDIVEEVRSK